MIMKKQAGQAIILVLILLAIGTFLLEPAIRLTSTTLISSEVVGQKTREIYAADGGQEYVFWKLLYQFSSLNLTIDVPHDLTIDVCGMTVNVSLIMRATATWAGVTLISDTPIKPTKTVTPNINPGGSPVTYTIRLEQITGNMSQGLDAVYDILPADFNTADYISGSSRLSVDGGPWQDVIGNPLIEEFGGVSRLRWPASGNFASPIRNFAGGQVKEIQFQMATSNLKNNATYYNWVVLKPWNTLSGATGIIVTGTGEGPVGGLVDVKQQATPAIVTPGVTTDIKYTINITNQQGSTDQIQNIKSYLPPGFSYIGPTSNLTTIDPVATYGAVNGVNRWKLEWARPQFPGGGDISISSEQTKTLTFWARTSENASGSYYNEVTVQMRNPSTLRIFQPEYYISAIEHRIYLE